MSEQRLIEVETKLAYLEDANQTLSDELIRMHALIERLQLRIDKLQGELQAGEGPGEADERPPHY